MMMAVTPEMLESLIMPWEAPCSTKSLCHSPGAILPASHCPEDVNTVKPGTPCLVAPQEEDAGMLVRFVNVLGLCLRKWSLADHG